MSLYLYIFFSIPILFSVLVVLVLPSPVLISLPLLTVFVSEMEADFDQALKPSFPREGESLALSCRFSSDLLSYQRALLWFKDGIPLQESQCRQLHTGSRSATLTINQVYKEDEGLYSILLPTLTGVKQQSAYVFVRGMKQIS
ncbi:MYOM3 protein, partial [Polyodon spathula]|nr:MYOM3 protein [Polyodon spathula]